MTSSFRRCVLSICMIGIVVAVRGHANILFHDSLDSFLV